MLGDICPTSIDVALTVAEFICREKLRNIWLNEVKTQLTKLEDAVLASNVLARYRLVSSIAGGEGAHVCATCKSAATSNELNADEIVREELDQDEANQRRIVQDAEALFGKS